MGYELIQQLKDWRTKKAQEENVELYLVMQNKTIEAIADALPSNEEEFIAIKGLGEKKFQKYGAEILALISGENIIEEKLDSAEEDVYSVSKFLDLINSKFANIEAKVKGEISSVDIRSGYLFFTLKDAEDGSLMSCFMWLSDYELCGIDLEIGMEIIVHGVPDIYKPSGRFSLRADSVELVGEGALKKAYDELKKKLTVEGIFDESKKRQIPTLPTRIGLITSKTGAVIHDFGNNLGRFGFITKFYDSRVEGALAIQELTEALKYFRNKEIDILVVIRGGGSLESLQAFNNEALIRQITDYPVPVLCGIGHDKDVTLFAMATDKSFSTPTAVAKEISQSWEQAINTINLYESEIVHKFTVELSGRRSELEDFYHKFSNNYHSMVRRVTAFDQIIINIANNLFYNIKNSRDRINQSVLKIMRDFSATISDSNIQIGNSIKLLQQNNPNRQLKLGYSIIFSGNRVIKSIDQLEKNNILRSRLSDGEVISIVEEIKIKE